VRHPRGGEFIKKKKGRYVWPEEIKFTFLQEMSGSVGNPNAEDFRCLCKKKTNKRKLGAVRKRGKVASRECEAM